MKALDCFLTISGQGLRAGGRRSADKAFSVRLGQAPSALSKKAPARRNSQATLGPRVPPISVERESRGLAKIYAWSYHHGYRPGETSRRISGEEFKC